MNERRWDETEEVNSQYRCSECSAPIFRQGKGWTHWIIPRSYRHHMARPKIGTGISDKG
jgi:hypothetical protein